MTTRAPAVLKTSDTVTGQDFYDDYSKMFVQVWTMLLQAQLMDEQENSPNALSSYHVCEHVLQEFHAFERSLGRPPSLWQSKMFQQKDTNKNNWLALIGYNATYSFPNHANVSLKLNMCRGANCLSSSSTSLPSSVRAQWHFSPIYSIKLCRFFIQLNCANQVQSSIRYVSFRGEPDVTTDYQS